jgi:hypothetical protein
MSYTEGNEKEKDILKCTTLKEEKVRKKRAEVVLSNLSAPVTALKFIYKKKKDISQLIFSFSPYKIHFI